MRNGGTTGGGGSVVATCTVNTGLGTFDDVVSAMGNGGGNGGTIRLKNLGLSGILVTGSDIRVGGTGGAIGGIIDIDAGTGPITAFSDHQRCQLECDR